jgi:hypothetical protein
MKLKSSILSEGKVKFDYRNGKVEFNTSIKNGNIILLPKTSKDLDTITHIKTQLGNERYADEDFRTLTIVRLKTKTGLDFEIDSTYHGAGYSFKIKEDSLLNLLEKTETSMNLSNIVENILSEGPAENKKVKALLDKHLKDLKKGGANHQWAIMHILMGALGDANFHSEAKRVSKLFPKAKYEGDPMAKKDLENMYHYELGADIASICKWDGKVIVDALGYYISMTLGRPLGQKVEDLVENVGMRLFKESVNEGKDVGHYERVGNQTIVDSNFVNYSKGVLPNSELVHLGMGDFAIKSPNGTIKFERSGKMDGIGQDFVGRPHRMTDDANGKLVDMFLKLMLKKKKAILSMSESVVNEGYGEFIKAKNLSDIITLSKKKKNAVFYVTDDRIGTFYLKNGKFAKATSANANYDLQHGTTTLRDRSDVIYKYKVDESVNESSKDDEYADKLQKATEKVLNGKDIKGWKLHVDSRSGTFEFEKKGIDLLIYATPMWDGKPNLPFNVMDSEGNDRIVIGRTIGNILPFKPSYDLNKDVLNYISVITKTLPKVEALYNKIKNESVNEASTPILKPGTKVKLRGGKSGKIVRFDGKTPGSPFYIVDIGQYYSLEVPAHEIQTESTNKSVNEAQYQVYHKSFTSAADTAKEMVEKRGFEVDMDDWNSQVAMGGKYSRSRPSIGKTNSFTIGLSKAGKPQKKSLSFQVYGMDSGNYELNAYIN